MAAELEEEDDEEEEEELGEGEKQSHTVEVI